MLKNVLQVLMSSICIVMVLFIKAEAVQPEHSGEDMTLRVFNEKCGIDMMTQLLYQKFPDSQPANNPAIHELEEFTAEFTALRPGDRNGLSGISANEVKIIPIVFHIIHQYGEENISDEQVLSALQVLNEDFRDNNPNRADLVVDFQGLEGDAMMQFALPTLDPDGNPTTGIERIYDPAFEYGDDFLMQATYNWPRDKYLNIYVVKYAHSDGYAAYSLYPSTVDKNPELDGVVLSHWACGTTGTAIWSHYRVISHEVGHWANLIHTWGDRYAVGDTKSCRTDDRVDDTPNCIGLRGSDPLAGPDGCNMKYESCQTLDMIQNHMDYSFCPIVFTLGQCVRMGACLNSTTADRNYIWTYANLVDVGLAE